MVLRQKRLVLSCPIPTHTPGAPTPKTPGDSVGCKATIYHSRAVRSSNRRQVSICNPVWARARQLWDATLRLLPLVRSTFVIAALACSASSDAEHAVMSHTPLASASLRAFCHVGAAGGPHCVT